MESVGDWPGQPGLRCCVASYLVILVGWWCSELHSSAVSVALPAPLYDWLCLSS